MKVTSRERNGIGILQLMGEFDSFETELVREAFDAFLAQGRSRVVIDLADLTFANSTTIAYLITAQRRATAKGGKVVLARPRDFIFKTLKTLGLEHVFVIADSVDDAITALKP